MSVKKCQVYISACSGGSLSSHLDIACYTKIRSDRWFGLLSIYSSVRMTRRKKAIMRYALLIDADDTLWENNIYFEQAIHAFVTFLDHSRLTRSEVRAVLDEVERLMGYGSANFARSLVETYRRLAEKDLQEEDIEQVRRFGEQIHSQPLQLLEGVRETLEYLSPRHDLFL